jgi:hypothetical protein
MGADDWEVFSPFDGAPKFRTDSEATARSIASDYELDYAPRGMEAGGADTWVEWRNGDGGV